MSIEDLVGFEGRMHVVDIGAAAIAEMPPYSALLKRGLARLTAVDGDERHGAGIVAAYGPETRVVGDILADGRPAKLHLATPASGMSSILTPFEQHLAFFNGFSDFGRIERVVDVQTRRMADVEALRGIDYLKMDIQGAELTVLRNAGDALDECVAIQLEVSFITLYKNQPTFGDVDVWMRAKGFQPHCFVDVKRWSIAPTIRQGEFRYPYNQLLEGDIVYMRGLTDLSCLSERQLRNMLLIAAYCYNSPDLAVHAARELHRRDVLAPGSLDRVVAAANAGALVDPPV